MSAPLIDAATYLITVSDIHGTPIWETETHGDSIRDLLWQAHEDAYTYECRCTGTGDDTNTHPDCHHNAPQPATEETDPWE